MDKDKLMECPTCGWVGKEDDCLGADRLDPRTGQLFTVVHCPVCFFDEVARPKITVAS